MKAMRFIPLTLVMTLSSMPTGAVDLTGSWLGKLICTYNIGFKGSYVDREVLLGIVQVGNDLLMDWSNDNIADASGFVINDLNKPGFKGQTALVYCSTTSDLSAGYGEIINLSANVDRSRVRGTLKGKSIYAYPLSNPPAEIGECRWVFKLISTLDPGISACPAP